MHQLQSYMKMDSGFDFIEYFTSLNYGKKFIQTVIISIEGQENSDEDRGDKTQTRNNELTSNKNSNIT